MKILLIYLFFVITVNYVAISPLIYTNRSQKSTQLCHSSWKWIRTAYREAMSWIYQERKTTLIQKQRYVLVQINEKLTKIIIDTGSDASLMNMKYYNEVKTPELCQENECMLTEYRRVHTMICIFTYIYYILTYYYMYFK